MIECNNRERKKYLEGRKSGLLWRCVIGFFVALAFLAGVGLAFGAQAEAALAHRSAHFQQKEFGYIFYVSTEQNCVRDPLSRVELTNQMRFAVASSSTQQVIERCTPQKVASGLYVIDLRNLGWSYKDFGTVLKSYPYAHANLPLIIRADWLIAQLGDESTSQARPLLLYGNAKLTHQEFLKFWGVSDSDPFGYIEGQSGVGVAKKRWIETRTSNRRGNYWGTRDSAVINRASDPLENPDNVFQFDAGEAFFLMPKVSIETYERGNLLDCILFDGNGRRQTIAPGNIVDGGTNFRGVGQIQNVGACIACHFDGIKLPTKYEFRESLESGYRLFSYDKAKAEKIELFHLGEVVPSMQADTALFAAGIRLTNGLTIEDNARQFVRIFGAYDADVTLAQAAYETGYAPDDLRLAIGHASNKYRDIGARLATLASGQAMRRSSFESEYCNLLSVISYAKRDGVIK